MTFAFSRKALACIFGLTMTLGLAAGPPAARAELPSAAAGALSPEQAQRALEVLQDDTRRQQVIEVLQAVSRAEPATPAPASTEEADDLGIASDGLLAAIIATTSDWLSSLSGYLARVGATVSSLPLVWQWLVNTIQNPFAQSTALDVGWRLAVVLAIAWGAGRLARYALRRPMRLIEGQAGASAVSHRLKDKENPSAAEGVASKGELRLLRRAPWAALHLVLQLIPVVVFAIVGNSLLATPLGQDGLRPMIILTALNAFVLQHGIMALGHAVFAAEARSLRLFHLSDESAAYAEVWLSRVTLVIYGFAGLEIARMLGLYPAAYDAAAKLLVLLNHLLLVVVVLQLRAPVTAMIEPAPGTTGGVAMVRHWIARTWHIFAILSLFVLWFVWAMQIENGYSLFLRYCGATVAVLILARFLTVLLLGAIDRAFRIQAETTARLPFLEGRANRYTPLLRKAATALIFAVTTLAILEIWGIDVTASFHEGGLGQRLAGSAIVILCAGVLAVMIWEGVNAWMDGKVATMASRGEYASAARLRTILPLLRTTLMVVVIAIVGFTALAQLGVNIAPLLAGAGILGVAVGFGSQKLVQDVITGIFLLLENTMQVGDWVTVAGLSGTVENLSIRTIRLRAGDGSVHVIPFSSVTTLTNTNRGIGNASVAVTVAFDEDEERVGQVLKEIGAELRQDPAFKDGILDDFALWGVDKVEGATFTVVGQIKCTDTARWGVQREFNKRIKRRFAELGITIGIPGQGYWQFRGGQPVPEPA